LRGYFVRNPLRRRFIALTAAYAIALSSLIASFGVGRAAADPAGAAGGIICHTLAGQSAPEGSGNGTNSKICADDCCTGCLMLMAALPPPPALLVEVRQVAPATPPPRSLALVGETTRKSHRSRAPPPAA
jgi:hypothetical protein